MDGRRYFIIQKAGLIFSSSLPSAVIRQSSQTVSVRTYYKIESLAIKPLPNNVSHKFLLPRD